MAGRMASFLAEQADVIWICLFLWVYFDSKINKRMLIKVEAESSKKANPEDWS